ncbi:MAG: methylated-DNA--[protein]-cysteine S-methyltransferase [Deltaproteobacteria bacterium]|nr:methylated-DNA--[protein]-cysteine S-methyltransferase [Deltaproteobacteria bacterium]
MTHFRLSLESPVGRLRIVTCADGLTEVSFGAGAARGAEAPGHPLLRRAATQLAEYFAGTRQEFELPLAAAGTPFQRAVWKELCTIGFGVTCSYAELAKSLGKPSAARAVGAANGQNPIAIVVPCHRVVGADGTLTGYAGGLLAKRWLLDHEREVRARQVRSQRFW